MAICHTDPLSFLHYRIILSLLHPSILPPLVQLVSTTNEQCLVHISQEEYGDKPEEEMQEN